MMRVVTPQQLKEGYTRLVIREAQSPFGNYPVYDPVTAPYLVVGELASGNFLVVEPEEEQE